MQNRIAATGVGRSRDLVVTPRKRKRIGAGGGRVARKMKLTVLLALAAVAHATTGRRRQVDKLDRSILFPDGMSASTYSMHYRIMSTWKAPVVHYGSESISPITYGADPTGVKDSSAAFQQAVAVLLAQNTSGHVMAANITDLGGAVLDLEGGDYLLSAPIVIPKMYGNFRIVDGTLRASQSFPRDRYLIEMGGPCFNQQKTCNMNIGLNGLTLDASHVATGCILLTATMGVIIDSSSVIIGFNKTGIYIDGGHGTMITETWIGSCYWSQACKADTNATGIYVGGNDHYMTNTIVYSARIGVWLDGSANVMIGVHTWNQATGQGGIGILNSKGQNRLDTCYLDFTDLRLEDADNVYVGNSFFLGGGQIVLAATGDVKTSIYGLTIIGNIGNNYNKGETLVAVNETQGTWSKVTDVTILNSNMDPGGYVQCTKVVTFTGLDTLTSPQLVDFSDCLLFPNIPIKSATAQIVGTLKANAVPPSLMVGLLPDTSEPQKVTVHSAVPAGAFAADNWELHVTADQSLHSDTFNLAVGGAVYRT